MMNNFSAPGDGIDCDFNRSSSPQQAGRLYPSLDSLVTNSDSFDEIDSDTASTTSAPRVAPPVDTKYLYPRKEFVDHSQPEEVRWFYKGESDKKWTAFIGYDSLRMECRYRVQRSVDANELSNVDLDVILARGGLYEVDVPAQTCRPVYWSGDVCKIMRGIWFYDNWQPMEEGYATQVETEHLATFLGHRIDDVPPVPVKGYKPVVHHMKFVDFYIDWNSPSQVYTFSESASSKLFRAVGNKFGVQKSGSRLHRGYCYEAVMEDKPVDITHLVFVIHGIGQKMDTGAIVKSCQELRDRVDHVMVKLAPDFGSRENQRAEFLPVEWRSSLRLDGDTVESLTPLKMRGIRNILNSSAMDVLYYSSPLYRSEITHSLEKELNRLYQMFCERHPYFEPNGGKVSLIAHSLGAVIAYDIITGWNPMTLYDQYVTSVIQEEEVQAAGSAELLAELDKAKKRVGELEMLLKAIHEKQHTRSSSLQFQLENLFCLGSPLGVFLALRGVRPQAKGSLDHIIPKGACKRLFNVYHPADPVAYRLEPLILKHYSTVKPLVIHSYETPNKVPYTRMESLAYAAFHGSSEVLDHDRSDISDKDSVDSAGSSSLASSSTSSPSRKKKIAFKVSSSVGGWFSGIAKSINIDDDRMAAELKMFNKMKREAEKNMEKSSRTKLPSPSMEMIEHTDLEYRLDYQLRDPGGLTGGYISMVTSHTAYWTNKDIACFLMMHLHPQLQDS